MSEHVSIEKSSTPPQAGGEWFFLSSRVEDRGGQTVRVTRSFAHRARHLAVLIGEAAMASPAARYSDTPRLAAKRRRALDRALLRGRRSQIEGALASFTGEPRWSPNA